MPYIGRTLGQGTRSRFLYTATAGQTTFSGSDSQSNTLAYADNNGLDCFQNGVLLKGGGADYTATSGTSVVLTTGASVNDVIEILVYDVFAIADHVKKSGDAMTGALTNIDVNGTEIILDADGDTSITSDTDDRVDIKVGGSDKVHITSTGLGIGTSSPSVPLHVVSSTTQTNDSTPALTVETQGHAQIRLNGDGNEFAIMALDSAVAGDHFIIYDKNNSAERFRIKSDGTVGINNSSPSGCKLEVSYANADVGMVVSTTDTFSSGNSSLIQFKEVDTVGGSIVFTNGGSSTAYAQSSDYRLKENVTYEFDATTRLKELKPCRFNFKKTPDITVDGFLAHEVTAVPEAIIGEKDAVDKDGNIEAQQIDQAKLVPLLTKALQEAVAKIETLEAKVTALEGK